MSVSDRRDRRLSWLVMRVVAACTRRPAVVIAAAALLCAGGAFYVYAHFAIDTDSARLIAEAVPWRQRELAFAAAFPRRADLIVVVVDGATPELAEQATASLAERLAGDGRHFRAVWRPDGGPFFDHAGLLFESTDEENGEGDRDQVVRAIREQPERRGDDQSDGKAREHRDDQPP